MFSSAVTRFGEVSSARRRLAKGKSDFALTYSRMCSGLGVRGAGHRTSKNPEAHRGPRSMYAGSTQYASPESRD